MYTTELLVLIGCLIACNKLCIYTCTCGKCDHAYYSLVYICWSLSSVFSLVVAEACTQVFRHSPSLNAWIQGYSYSTLTYLHNIEFADNLVEGLHFKVIATLVHVL